MHPSIEIGGWILYSYGLAIVLGALLGGVWAWRSRPPGLFTASELLWICLLTTFGASWGAQSLGLASGSPGKLASTGAALLVGPLVAGYCLAAGLDLRRVFDHLMPFAVFGAAFQRTFGCFLGGCCRGLPSQGWAAVRFPESAQTVHPAQLYLGLSLFAVFFALLRWRPRVAGRRALVALGLYGLVGCLVSPFRAGMGEPLVLGFPAYGLVHGGVAAVAFAAGGWLGRGGERGGAAGSRGEVEASA